ncbi:MAG TPA: sigma-70 family RNA polymerase sigma factor [Solirubrobacteraceae bacterium]|jgi:RNA polymerase sigma-70 factor (ECF subfamily)
MIEQADLAREFEAHRARLRAIAERILGTPAEADDAVQETWLRLSRTDAAAIENLGAWLTTVVSRVCLNVLRAREARREDLAEQLPDPVVAAAGDPLAEAELADGVGIALLVVLETLSPPERVAFVLHDLFAVPFGEIGTLLDRTPEAARQLASRARRRVRGGTAQGGVDRGRRQAIVDAFLAAGREGDFAGLLAVLDPDVVLRADFGPGGVRVTCGADRVAAQAGSFGKDTEIVTRRALVNGVPGSVSFRDGRPFSVLAFTIAGDRIAAIDILADPERLAGLDLSAVV